MRRFELTRAPHSPATEPLRPVAGGLSRLTQRSIAQFSIAGAGALVLLGFLGGCAQTGEPVGSGQDRQRMGAPGGINQTDTNLENTEEPAKSGPPSTVQPEQ